MKESVGNHFPTLLAALFLYSGGYKLMHPGDAAYALMSLDLHQWLANTTVVFVTTLELYLGLLLLAKVSFKYSLTVSTGLLLLFTGFLWYLTTMAHPPACGCLGLTGMFSSTKKAAMFGILRNCFLLWGLRFSYDYYVKPASALPSAGLKVA